MVILKKAYKLRKSLTNKSPKTGASIKSKLVSQFNQIKKKQTLMFKVVN